MTDLRKAAEMALEALEMHVLGFDGVRKMELAIESLEAALAQSEQDSKQEHESRITALEVRVSKLENPITDHEKQLMAGQRSLLRTTSVSKPEPVVEPANSATNFVESKHLAQPEQEPVAAVELIEIGSEQVIAVAWYDSNAFKVGTKLYTAPPSKPWVSLTDEEIMEPWPFETRIELVRWIEAKLREKNK